MFDRKGQRKVERRGHIRTCSFFMAMVSASIQWASAAKLEQMKAHCTGWTIDLPQTAWFPRCAPKLDILTENWEAIFLATHKAFSYKNRMHLYWHKFYQCFKVNTTSIKLTMSVALVRGWVTRIDFFRASFMHCRSCLWKRHGNPPSWQYAHPVQQG